MKRRTVLGLLFGAPLLKVARLEAGHPHDIKPTPGPKPMVAVGGRHIDLTELTVTERIDGDSSARFHTLSFCELFAPCTIDVDGQRVFNGRVQSRTLHRHPRSGGPLYYEVYATTFDRRRP
jgi:hypothetical protein